MTTVPPAKPHLFGLIAGLFLAAGLCFAAVTFTRTWVHLKESQIIQVTGSARKNIRSDLVVWSAVLRVEAKSLPEAYTKLNGDSEKLRAFLTARGQTKYEFSPVVVRDVARRKKEDDDAEAVPERSGYQLFQPVQVESSDVEGLPKLAADALSLMAQDVVVQTAEIKFIYTKAGQAKLEMMAEATEDARKRAEVIARQGGRQVRELRSAKVGVVQINPMHSTGTSWEGNNDQSTADKTMTATISAEFSLR